MCPFSIAKSTNFAATCKDENVGLVALEKTLEELPKAIKRAIKSLAPSYLPLGLALLAT